MPVRRREQVVLATILNHFPLLDEFDETIDILNFQALRLTSYGKKSYCCMSKRLTLTLRL